MTRENLTMPMLSQQDEQIAHSEQSNVGNPETSRRASLPAESLRPPTWSLDQCGVGFDGQTGCRVCIDTCPYEAIRPLTAPDGLRIHIDPGICQRCGACTSACPTSALTRAFMSDQEIDAQVARALSIASESPVLLFVHEASRVRLESMPADLPFAVLTLPSLLIINETHLLLALRRGARGAAIVGHPEGHHCAPHFFEAPLRIARASLPPEDGARLAYVEDDGADGAVESLTGFIRALRAPAARESNEPMKVEGGHRERLAALMAATAAQSGATTRLEDVPFGEVAVAESGCTLCSACSRVCPTAALDFHTTGGRLTFAGIDCIGCSLCQRACPEHVLTLTPGLQLAPELFKPRTLVEDEVLPCRVCGAPHLPKRLLDHARKVVSGTHPQTLSMQQIDLCPRCRSVEAEVVRHRNSQPKEGCGSGRCGCGGREKGRGPKSTESAGMSRRDFIGGLSVTLGGLAALATGKTEGAQPNRQASPELGTKRLGMVIDLERCIGCHACNQACPYGVPFMDPVRGTADKCNFCSHRVDEGLNPACVNICPSSCRIFGDLNDPESAPSRALQGKPHQVLRQELGLGPNVRYLGLPAELDR